MEYITIRRTEPSEECVQTFVTNVTCLANWLILERKKKEREEEEKAAKAQQQKEEQP